MASQKPETVFDIESLFSEINSSFTNAALKLQKTFNDDPEWKGSPFVYHMPKMHLSMRLALTHSDGKVKGFFQKSKTEREEQIVSTIDVEVVAVPNPRIDSDSS